MSDAEIVCERRGSVGAILLNRPKALNALTLGMVREMARALDAWEGDPGITRIVVTGAGDRAFCAGGDIRKLYEAGRAGDITPSLTFWREEYILNVRIRSYPKPYISLIDGIVMGGGVGVSLHGSHRVAGDRYSFAMPEVGIGFFPDVGGMYALARLPGEMGTYLALTGARIGPDDAAALGLATHRVPSERMAALEEALVAGEPVDGVLAASSRPVADAPLLAHSDVIARCFGASSPLAILAALDADGSDFAAETAATIRKKAPSSVAIAFEQIRRAPAMSFEDTMAAEYRIVSRIAEGHDFYEGVRATIIDKDGAPRWQPARLEDLDPGFAASHFEPLPGRELRDPV
ncbi:enoyl-CoA hydratase/isomerase family protein [Enterovirga rhinocerotis]|uniref:3-hydroxyisobutyryl-CoA hydrolase n=1 Tax=Enterovirga rhinocerotis TaxID=1339210 RepID=A0A4R7C816_9HYPH|nr:enoyl-CoA hydratase/isomerase family protein [Enterovirga rhinocerotis]TDR94578.1 enoyl-CoA hydratase [Enterovirga rhinocerotis]